jgi:ATP-dependent helicase HrpB
MQEEIILVSGYPLSPFLPDIRKALETHGAAVLRSDPGSGKSTLVPLALLDGADRGTIIMLEPRRAAALGIASRMAELLGEEPGKQVGYAVRLERRGSAKTRIEVITEGLLIRRLQNDPALGGISTIIFDEFHERQAAADLALALVMDLRRMGSPVRLLIMSATMDAAASAAFIDRVENRAGEHKTPVFDCPGRIFPVEISYRPRPERGPLGKETAAALGDILCPPGGGRTGGGGKSGPAGENGGDILVFLPGRREIADAEAALRAMGMNRDIEIFTLHGGLPLARQKEVISPEESRRGGGGKKRRIILSTNLAETGLTIPGITVVADSGYARLERFHLPTGMNRLILEPISLRSADQRAGRAGRLGPGRCVRLWAQGDLRPKETDPEIRRVDLSSLALECLLWGIKNPDDLPWPESPPSAAWNRAVETLKSLNAIDETLNPTGLGREIAGLGLDPPLGRLCLAGRERGLAPLACVAAALLAGRDGSGIREDADFRPRLELVRRESLGAPEEDRPGAALSGRGWIKGVRETAGDLLMRLGLGKRPLDWSPESEAGIGELLAPAFPGRICRRHGPSPVFRFVSGREARIEGPLGREEWLCAAEVDAGERSGLIRLAAPLSEETALMVLEKGARTEQRIEWKGLLPRLRVTKNAGRLLLSEERRLPRREEIFPELPRLLEEQGIAILPWEEDEGRAKRFLERIRFFAARETAGTGSGNPPQPLWTDKALIAGAAEWLGPFIWDGGETAKGPLITGQGLLNALAARLGWETKRELDNLVPEYFSLPKGRKKPIDYAGTEPAVKLRLQDAFGIPGVPRVLSVPIVFHLLSPAGRPIQITNNLPGFWAGSYAEVRKEMRGRYPKHFWPENPPETAPGSCL